MLKYILKQYMLYTIHKFFVFIMHQVYKHGVSGRCITETGVKHIRSGALRTITNIAKEYTFYGKL